MGRAPHRSRLASYNCHHRANCRCHWSIDENRPAPRERVFQQNRPEADSYVGEKRTFNLRVAPQSLVADARDDRNACQWIGRSCPDGSFVPERGRVELIGDERCPFPINRTSEYPLEASYSA